MGQVQRLLEEVWGRHEGYVFLPHRANGKWHEQDHGYLWRGKVDGLTVNPSQDVYWCPLVFDRRRRLARYALPTHVLWADLDAASPYECRLRPSVAWQTTQGVSSHDHDIEGRAEADYCSGCENPPHYQALWFLKQDDTANGEVDKQWGIARERLEAAEAAQLSKRIAHAEPGADKGGWDVTQVLRLPGTRNHKHRPAHKVELLWAEKRYYTVAQVEAAYPAISKTTLPPVPHDSGDWIEVSAEALAAARAKLPMGIQMALERPDDADRSLELVRLAREMVRFKTPPELIPHLLLSSKLGQSKFGSRRDAQERLLTIVADALLQYGDPSKGGGNGGEEENQGGTHLRDVWPRGQAAGR